MTLLPGTKRPRLLPIASPYSSTLRRIHLRWIHTETAGPLEWHASCFFLIFPSLQITTAFPARNTVFTDTSISPAILSPLIIKTPEFFLPGWKATLASREKLSPLPKVQENLLFQGKELITPAKHQGGLDVPGCKPLCALNCFVMK